MALRSLRIPDHIFVHALFYYALEGVVGKYAKTPGFKDHQNSRLYYHMFGSAQALARRLADDWPVELFEGLVRAVVDVADAKVVHVDDGAGQQSDISAETDFWRPRHRNDVCRSFAELAAR